MYLILTLQTRNDKHVVTGTVSMLRIMVEGPLHLLGPSLFKDGKSYLSGVYKHWVGQLKYMSYRLQGNFEDQRNLTLICNAKFDTVFLV